MSTITTPNPPADQRAAELRAADREQAAIARLAAAVVTMRTRRQLAAPAPARHPAAGPGASAHSSYQPGSAA